MIQEPDELVEAIRNASDLASKWEPDHPQYIEGMFYLTEAQWAAIRNEWPIRRGFNDGQLIWGIPVKIVKPNTIVDLPSGKVLIYSAVMESFYTFDRAIADDAGLRSGVAKVT